MPRFYTETLPSSESEFVLPDDVHRHAIQVLRLKQGANIRLFNGQGMEYEAELTLVEKRQSRVRLGEPITTQKESPLDITLLQGISRGERMDFAIQKAVELGVKKIVPVITERCNVQLSGDRADKRFNHWTGVMVSACEQSGRSFLPELTAVQTYSTVLSDYNDELNLVLDPLAQKGFSELTKPVSLTMLIGPEGGLSDAEIEMAKDTGYQAVQFGPRILRTETAAVAALAVAQTLWGDLG